MTTMKAMDSFSFGTPMRAQYTSNKTWVVCGDEDYRCELVEGDYIFLINFMGYRTETYFTGIEDDNLIVDGAVHVPLNAIVFIGRINE